MNSFGSAKKKTFKRKSFRKSGFKPKVCRFCQKKSEKIDYKDASLLRSFITDRGKILPGFVTGNCAKHQRKMTKALKRARNVKLIPFVVK